MNRDELIRRSFEGPAAEPGRPPRPEEIRRALENLAGPVRPEAARGALKNSARGKRPAGLGFSEISGVLAASAAGCFFMAVFNGAGFESLRPLSLIIRRAVPPDLMSRLTDFLVTVWR